MFHLSKIMGTISVANEKNNQREKQFRKQPTAKRICKGKMLRFR